MFDIQSKDVSAIPRKLKCAGLIALSVAAVGLLAGSATWGVPPTSWQEPLEDRGLDLERVSLPDPGLADSSWTVSGGAQSSDELVADCRGDTCKNSAHPCISDDGGRIAFTSDAFQVVAGQENWTGKTQVYVRDMRDPLQPRTHLVSADRRLGLAARGRSDFSGISGDGRFVVFGGGAKNLVLNGARGYDVFLYELPDRLDLRGVMLRVSEGRKKQGGNGLSVRPSINRDGRYVVYETTATNLARVGPLQPSGDTRQVHLFDRFGEGVNRTRWLTVGRSAEGERQVSTHDCLAPKLSDQDPPRVAYYSASTNLGAQLGDRWVQDQNQYSDVFVRDLKSGKTLAVSVDVHGQLSGNGDSRLPSLSADGRWVAFESSASNLVQGDTNNCADIFVRDLREQRTVLVSVLVDGSGKSRASVDGNSVMPVLSGDGRIVIYTVNASNFFPEWGEHMKLIAHDRDADGDGVFDETGVGERRTWCLSKTYSGEPADGWAGGGPIGITRDGRHAAFMSEASNLVPGDRNGRAGLNPDFCCGKPDCNPGFDREACDRIGARRVGSTCAWGRDIFRVDLFPMGQPMSPSHLDTIDAGTLR